MTGHYCSVHTKRDSRTVLAQVRCLLNFPVPGVNLGGNEANFKGNFLYLSVLYQGLFVFFVFRPSLLLCEATEQLKGTLDM